MEYYINSDLKFLYPNLIHQYYTNNVQNNNIIGIFIDLNNYKTYYNEFIYDNYKTIPNLPRRSFNINILTLNIQNNKQENIIISVPKNHVNSNINEILKQILCDKSIIFHIDNHKYLISLESIMELKLKFTSEEHEKYNKIKHFISNPYITSTLFNNIKSNLIIYNSKVINHNIMIEVMKFLYKYIY